MDCVRIDLAIGERSMIQFLPGSSVVRDLLKGNHLPRCQHKRRGRGLGESTKVVSAFEKAELMAIKAIPLLRESCRRQVLRLSRPVPELDAL